MIARIKDFIRTAGGESIITLVTKAECAEEIDELKDAEIDVTLKKHRKRRSLDANAYAWVLIDKIAAATGHRPDHVYRQAIRHVAGASEYVCVKEEAYEALAAAWTRNGIGWQAECFPSKIDGCVNARLWYGSSTYDTKQMTALIDVLCEDCRALCISVETPDEIARIKSLWGNER